MVGPAVSSGGGVDRMSSWTGCRTGGQAKEGCPQAGGLGGRQGVLAEVDTGGGARRDEELALGGWSLRWLHDTENAVGSSEERSEAETQLWKC